MKNSVIKIATLAICSVFTLTSCNEILGIEDNPTGGSTTNPYVDNSEIIQFKDSYLEALLVQYFDKNLDYKLSKAEAAAVVDIQKIFEDNTYITSFDELQYFTRLKFLGEKAFSHCDNLKSITIPGSVEKISRFAFNACYSLTDVNILDGVKIIEYGAFDICGNIENIIIPSSVEKISASSFYYPYKAKITIDPGNKTYDSRDNCNCIIETATNTIIVGGKNATFPSSIQNIGEKAFVDNTSLSGTVVLPNDLETIGNSAFASCKNIEGITFNNKLKSIGSNAFYSCNNLKSITLPDGLTEIGIEAFINCSALKSVKLPESLTTIGIAAFSGCTSLESITIPGSVKNVSEALLKRCTSLKEVILSEGVETIGGSVFDGEKNLPLLVLPSTLTSIGGTSESFSPVKVIIKATTPPTVGRYDWFSNSVVYVPASSVDAYKAADVWKNATIKSIDELESN